MSIVKIQHGEISHLSDKFLPEEGKIEIVFQQTLNPEEEMISIIRDRKNTIFQIGDVFFTNQNLKLFRNTDECQYHIFVELCDIDDDSEALDHLQDAEI